MGLLAHLTRRAAAGGWAWRAAGGSLRGLHTSSALLDPPAPEPVPLSKLKDSFLDGTSSTYLEELEERYRSNPASVDKTWASFFKSMGEPRPPAAAARTHSPQPPPRRLPPHCLLHLTRATTSQPQPPRPSLLQTSASPPWPWPRPSTRLSAAR